MMYRQVQSVSGTLKTSSLKENKWIVNYANCSVNILVLKFDVVLVVARFADGIFCCVLQLFGFVLVTFVSRVLCSHNACTSWV